jgi:hypothetical protein
MKFLTVALLGILSGCAAHTAQVKSAYSAPPAVELSGSPCLDGLFANINDRCTYSLAGASTYGDHVIVECSDPQPPSLDDALYFGYTAFTFLVFDNNNLDYIPDDLAYFCSDTVVSIGFVVERE